jgi:hypothetical protein
VSLRRRAVADRVIAEPLEVVILADAASAANAHLAEPIGSGEQGVFAELFHVGVNVHDGPARVGQKPLPKPPSAADPHVDGRKGERATTSGAEHVAPGGATPWLRVGGQLRRLGVKRMGHVVANLQSQQTPRATRQRKARRMPLLERRDPAHLPLDGQHASRRHGEQVDDHEKCQREVETQKRPENPWSAQQP